MAKNMGRIFQGNSPGREGGDFDRGNLPGRILLVPNKIIQRNLVG